MCSQVKWYRRGFPLVLGMKIGAFGLREVLRLAGGVFSFGVSLSKWSRIGSDTQ